MPKFWETPEVIPLAATTILNTVSEWTGIPGPPERSVTHMDGLAEVAARACYWSYGKGRKTNADHVGNLLASGHGSVFEHASLTVGLRGISRSLSHELVRHRAGFAYSQLSQRYVADEPEFVVPPGLEGAAKDQFYAACEVAAAEYRGLLNKHANDKRGREVARAVLPNATATRMVVTANVRALRHLFELRGSLGADAEFRRLAITWFRVARNMAPHSFKDMVADIDLETSQCVITSKYQKV